MLVNKGMGSEPPDWALKNVKGMKEQVGAILDDPMLLVEGMAQGISDTYESEGIWYCAGYAVGTYAGTKGIAEAGKAVKGKVEVKGKVGESGSNVIDMSKYTKLSNAEVIDILKGRGINNNAINDLISSFDGPIYKRIGYKGEKFIITESNFGDASGVFVTRGSAGKTPIERINNLALPPNNSALVESQVELSRT